MVVGVLALQGSFNEHIAGLICLAPFLFSEHLARLDCMRLRLMRMNWCCSAEKVGREGGGGEEAGAAAERQGPHHPRRRKHHHGQACRVP